MSVLNTKLADLRAAQGNYSEAEAIYRRLLGTNRDNLEALNNLAWQLALRGQKFDEALALIDRALDIAGSNPTLLDTRGAVLMQLDRGNNAVKALQEAVRSQPEKALYYFHLARAYQLTNSHVEAREALERSKALGLNEKTLDPLERDTYRKLHQQVGSGEISDRYFSLSSLGGLVPPAPIRRPETREFQKRKRGKSFPTVTVAFKNRIRMIRWHRSAGMHRYPL